MLAMAHGDYWWFRADTSPERLEKMKFAVDRAFELKPDMPEARLALANYHYRGFYDYEKAMEQLLQVVQMLPRDTIVLNMLGLTSRRLGQYRESIDYFMRSVEIDPTNESAWGDALETANESNQMDLALEIRRRLGTHTVSAPRISAELARTELFLFGNVEAARRIMEATPDVPHHYVVNTRYLIALYGRKYQEAAKLAFAEGNFDAILVGWGEMAASRDLAIGGFAVESRSMLDQALRILVNEVEKEYAQNYAWPHIALAHANVLDRNYERAREACSSGLSIMSMEFDKVHGPQAETECAWVQGMTGDQSAALVTLDRTLNQGYMMNYWHLTMDPKWDFLRNNERFDALLARAKAEMQERFEINGLEWVER
jgi:tetratricopeptide (TPR) repeat protein